MSKQNPTNDPAISSQNELDEQLSPLTNTQLKQQMSDLDREMAELDLEIKREQVQKIRAQKADKKAMLDARRAAAAAEIANRDYLRYHQCTHRKGGRGHNAVLGGQGNDTNFAVIHHILPSGRHMILCQRCGSEEYGPDPLTGEKETQRYQEFRRFQTDNTASGSSLFLSVGRSAEVKA